MRWRTRQIGDIRTVHRFLLWPRSTYRRIRQDTTTDPAGVCSKERETRWFEWAWIRQQWAHRDGDAPPGWIYISWENGCVPKEPVTPWSRGGETKTRKCEIGPPISLGDDYKPAGWNPGRAKRYRAYAIMISILVTLVGTLLAVTLAWMVS